MIVVDFHAHLVTPFEHLRSQKNTSLGSDR